MTEEDKDARTAAMLSMTFSLKRILDVLEHIEAKLTAPALFEIGKAVQVLVEADEAGS